MRLLLAVACALLLTITVSPAVASAATKAPRAETWQQRISKMGKRPEQSQGRTYRQNLANTKIINKNEALPPAQRKTEPTKCHNAQCTPAAGELKLNMTGSYYMDGADGNATWNAYKRIREGAHRSPAVRKKFYNQWRRGKQIRLATTNCSAYTAWMIDQATRGKTLLTAYTGTQWTEVQNLGGTTQRVSNDNPQPPRGGYKTGDLLFFNTYGTNSHVGIVMAGGKTPIFRHSSSWANDVAITNLDRYRAELNAAGYSLYGWARLPDNISA